MAWKNFGANGVQISDDPTPKYRINGGAQGFVIFLSFDEFEEYLEDRLQTGQTIGANTTGNANWNIYNGADFSTDPLFMLGYDLLNAQWRPVDYNVLKNKVREFQNYRQYSAYRNLGLRKQNGGLTIVGDSNSENFGGSSVNTSWVDILNAEIGKNQGSVLEPGFTHFNDNVRYGLSYSGSYSFVSQGPSNTAIQLNSGASITFNSATEIVEFWFNSNTSGGSIEISYNGVVYRNVPCNTVTKNNLSSYYANTNPVVTPSNISGTYTLTATGGSVVITALFKKGIFNSNYDNVNFLRAGVSGTTFNDFDYVDVSETTGILESSSTVLLALGTNSIYAASKATTSAQYAIDLTNAINTLRDNDTKVVYIIPPKTLETAYPPVLEPYSNYLSAMISVCNSLEVPYIDLNLLNMGAPFYVSDGLHYNDLGQLNIGNYIINQLAKIDLTQKTTPEYTTPTLSDVLTAGNSTTLSALFGQTVQTTGAMSDSPGGGALFILNNGLSSTSQRAQLLQQGLDGDLFNTSYNGSSFRENFRIKNNNGDFLVFANSGDANAAVRNSDLSIYATTSYADAKVQNNLTASTTVAPSATALNNALGLKLNLTGGTLTGSVFGTGFFSNNIIGAYAYLLSSFATDQYTSGASEFRIYGIPGDSPFGTSFNGSGFRVKNTSSNGEIAYRNFYADIGFPLTANRQYKFPDATGELALTSPYVEITGTSQTAVTGTKYKANNAARVFITLPTNSNSVIGSQVFVRGYGAGGWRIVQPEASTVIHGSSDTTIGITGYIESQARYDCITLEKIAANEWIIINTRGTLTVN